MHYAATDLLSTDEVCSRRDSETQIDCPFSIAQDDILETDEILVIVLSVVDDGGNSVTVGDNCAVATIFPGTSQGKKACKRNFKLLLILLQECSK